MANLLFLIVPLIVIIVVCTGMYLRTRRPSSVQSGIDGFRRELAALAPERAGDRSGRRPG